MQLLQVRHLSHLLKEPKFPSQFMPEYIRLLERFEVVLSQTPHTLLIPSHLPRKKPLSVIPPPASPGCEKMPLFVVFLLLTVPPPPPLPLPPPLSLLPFSSVLAYMYLLSFLLSLLLPFSPSFSSLPLPLSFSLSYSFALPISFLSSPPSLSLPSPPSLPLPFSTSVHSPDNPSLPVHIHSAWFLAQTGGQTHCIPQKNSTTLHQGQYLLEKEIKVK